MRGFSATWTVVDELCTARAEPSFTCDSPGRLPGFSLAHSGKRKPRQGEGAERGFLAGGAEVGRPRTYVLPDPERFNPCVPIQTVAINARPRSSTSFAPSQICETAPTVDLYLWCRPWHLARQGNWKWSAGVVPYFSHVGDPTQFSAAVSSTSRSQLTTRAEIGSGPRRAGKITPENTDYRR